MPDAPVLEDAGRPPKAKYVEDFITMLINEDGSHFFLVGSSLIEPKREEMVTFLKANIKVFPWTHYEMPGVDLNFIRHDLNVDPLRRPIIEKLRRSSVVHAKAVVPEVDKLLEA